VTVVVTVKDSCSQAPGFLDHLARTVPRVWMHLPPRCHTSTLRMFRHCDGCGLNVPIHQRVGYLNLVLLQGVHVIHTYPNFTSCSEIDLSSQAKLWTNFDRVPLNIHSSPMVGWLDAVTKNWVKTPYTYLVHNDGYALDDHFLCELLHGLQKRQATEPAYGIAAPML
jgi:hypothetical protein